MFYLVLQVLLTVRTTLLLLTEVHTSVGVRSAHSARYPSPFSYLEQRTEHVGPKHTNGAVFVQLVVLIVLILYSRLY